MKIFVVLHTTAILSHYILIFRNVIIGNCLDLVKTICDIVVMMKAESNEILNIPPSLTII